MNGKQHLPLGSPSRFDFETVSVFFGVFAIPNHTIHEFAGS
jgi:hypothetical protein